MKDILLSIGILFIGMTIALLVSVCIGYYAGERNSAVEIREINITQPCPIKECWCPEVECVKQDMISECIKLIEDVETLRTNVK